MSTAAVADAAKNDSNPTGGEAATEGAASAPEPVTVPSVSPNPKDENNPNCGADVEMRNTVESASESAGSVMKSTETGPKDTAVEGATTAGEPSCPEEKRVDESSLRVTKESDEKTVESAVVAEGSADSDDTTEKAVDSLRIELPGGEVREWAKSKLVPGAFCTERGVEPAVQAEASSPPTELAGTVTFDDPSFFAEDSSLDSEREGGEAAEAKPKFEFGDFSDVEVDVKEVAKAAVRGRRKEEAIQKGAGEGSVASLGGGTCGAQSVVPPRHKNLIRHFANTWKSSSQGAVKFVFETTKQ